MCCIIYKPKGVEMPSESILNKIQRINHDGYGFVSSMHHFKTMDYNKFLTHLSKVRTNEECLIHMRYATHGSICKCNCHPFKCGDIWFMHNGILPITPKEDRTDSETFFTKIYPTIARWCFGSPEADNAIKSMQGGSRFAFMQNGRVYLYGRYEEIDGVLYSNLRWLIE